MIYQKKSRQLSFSFRFYRTVLGREGFICDDRNWEDLCDNIWSINPICDIVPLSEIVLKDSLIKTINQLFCLITLVFNIQYSKHWATINRMRTWLNVLWIYVTVALKHTKSVCIFLCLVWACFIWILCFQVWFCHPTLDDHVFQHTVNGMK